MMAKQEPLVALALSGGGSRAMAFHLGCLRALRDRKILGKVKLMSTVSGGSVIGACWAYRGEDFAAFDRHVVSILRHGLQWDILSEAFFSWEAPKILATLLWTGTLSLILSLVSMVASRARRWLGFPTGWLEDWLAALARRLPVWGSLTTAFEASLARRLFGDRTIDQVQRPGLTTIVNTCELRTGTAFRFGSKTSGGWRYGEITGDPPTVAKAVAASAAFPILLPPLVETFDFEKKGQKHRDTVSLTDGGSLRQSRSRGSRAGQGARRHLQPSGQPHHQPQRRGRPVRRRRPSLLVGWKGEAIVRSRPSKEPGCRVSAAPQVRGDRRATRLRDGLLGAAG